MIPAPQLTYLLELLHALGPAADDFVVAGAQAMKFAVQKARGTKDVDFLLNVLALRKEPLQLAPIFERLGYRPVPESRNFQFEKPIPGSNEKMRIEFMAPEEFKREKDFRVDIQDGVHARACTGGSIALEQSDRHSISGKLPKGDDFTTMIRVTAPHALVMLKLLALADRYSNIRGPKEARHDREEAQTHAADIIGIVAAIADIPRFNSLFAAQFLPDPLLGLRVLRILSDSFRESHLSGIDRLRGISGGQPSRWPGQRPKSFAKKHSWRSASWRGFSRLRNFWRWPALSMTAPNGSDKRRSWKNICQISKTPGSLSPTFLRSSPCRDVSAYNRNQRAAAADFNRGTSGVLKQFCPRMLRRISGRDVIVNSRFLRSGHLRGGVVDDRQSGRPRAQRVIGRNGLRAAIKAHQLRRQHTARSCIACRANSVVRCLSVQSILRQITQNRRRNRLCSPGKWQFASKLTQLRARHWSNLRKVCIDNDVAQPEQDSIAVRGRSGTDLRLWPPAGTIEGVGSVGSAGVLKAQSAQTERLIAVFVRGQHAVREAVLLECGSPGRIGHRGVCDCPGRFGCLPAGEGIRKQCLVTLVSASVTNPWARFAVAVPSSAWEARSDIRWTMVTNWTP